MRRVSAADLARLGERLRALREDGGLSQKEVAERLGMTEVGYGHFERGRRLPSAADLPWLASGLGVSVGELLLRLGLVEARMLDGIVPEAIAGRIHRIVQNWHLLNTAEKNHITALLGLAGDYARSDSATVRHPDSRSDSRDSKCYCDTVDCRDFEMALRTPRVLAVV